MTATFGLEVGDVRILPQFVAGGGQDADERIVLGMNDERGHRYTVEHLCRRRASVVVLGVTKAAVAGRNLVVEVTYAAQILQVTRVVAPRIERCLALNALLQSAQELPFVDAVAAIMQRIGGGCQVHRR